MDENDDTALDMALRNGLEEKAHVIEMTLAARKKQ
jgi:hypothetical protein